MATCVEQSELGSAQGARKWIASGWGRGGRLGVGTHWGLGAVAARQGRPPQERVWLLGAQRASCSRLTSLALGPDPVCHQLDPETFLPAHGHLGVERHIRVGVPRCPPTSAPVSPLPGSLLYATSQCVNTGGSGLEELGPRAFGPELQNVCVVPRELGRGCWLPGNGRSRSLGGMWDGRAWKL